MHPLLLLVPLALAGSPVHHDLVVRLTPDTHQVTVTDTLSHLPPDLTFTLHQGLSPQVEGRGWRLKKVQAPSEGPVPTETWRLTSRRSPPDRVTLTWSGVLDHPLATAGREYQRGFSETPGTISPEGVYLAGSSAWIPRFDDELVTFDLQVTALPPGWDAVSQGARSTGEGEGTVRWRCPTPSEEIFLVAGPWTATWDQAGPTTIGTLLRQPDPALSWRYLEATRRTLALYSSLLGPYPYPSFLLVENGWETGYGMPGFTLLGPKILRFPWILTSSYPHEVLHDWWGNGVYVAREGGNWSEGLTAYLADHMFAEQRGEAVAYRRDTLRKYTDFAATGQDIPLSAFQGRDSAATEATGYGKGLMVMHMARRKVGDGPFLAALGRFYSSWLHKRASFSDLAASFQDPAMASFFQAWTTTPGAPRVRLVEASARPVGGGWETVVKVGVEGPFPVTVPVVLTTEAGPKEMSCEGTCTLVIPSTARPLRVDVDPAFDVMRILDPLEVEPSLSAVQGATSPLFVLPAAASPEEQAAWRELATAWSQPGTPRWVLDTEVQALPDGPAWILGWSNTLARALVERRTADKAAWTDRGVTLGSTEAARGAGSAVVVTRSQDPAQAQAWVAAPVAAIPGLARKLPHYGKYGWLTFQGDDPENTGKGTWEPRSSPLVKMLGDPVPLKLPPRKPLAPMPPLFDPGRVAGLLTGLTSAETEGRSLGSPGLERATALVEERLTRAGIRVERQAWTWKHPKDGQEVGLTNLLVRLPGTDPRLQDSPVLVMAHLDHLGLGWPDVREGNGGKVHPGADDDASGVAALVEVAGALAAEPARARPVILAFTTGEEADLLGSRHLLESLGATRPMACLNLDTVGRYGAAGKALVLDAASAREWRHIFMGVGFTTGATLEVSPSAVQGGDHRACLEKGIPGVQLTTGPGPDYHRPTDTADRLDPAGIARLAEVALETTRYLAERTDPLTAQGSSDATPKGGPRGVSLGTVPDFAFGGPGVRAQDVVPDSPAARAGIRPGDVVVAIDRKPVADLKGLSEALAAAKPGDVVTVTLRRSGQEVKVKATLVAR